MIDIPDDPMIRKMELYGTLHPEQEEGPDPICPICGKEAETFYFDYDHEIFGCDQCVTSKDAWEYTQEHKE